MKAGHADLEDPDGTVFLKNGMILLSQECDQILHIALELGYECELK